MGITLDTILESLHAIAIKDSTNGYELAIDSSGKINAKIEDDGNSITVDAVDLDIRDLSSGTDSVSAVQSGTWDIATLTSITNDVNIADGGNVISVDDAGGALTVDAVDLDIRDLTHVSDSIKVGDGTDFMAVNADGSINVVGDIEVTDAGYDTWLVTQATVTATESELVSTPLSGRIDIIIQNLGTQDCYLKEATGVTTANGLKLNKGSSFEKRLDDGANIFAITGSGTTDLRIAEFSA